MIVLRVTRSRRFSCCFTSVLFQRQCCFSRYGALLRHLIAYAATRCCRGVTGNVYSAL